MDINIKTIKEKLIMMQLVFDPNENAYSAISGIIKKTEDSKSNTIDLYQELLHFDDKTEMPQFLRDYLSCIMDRVKVLSSQDKEIENKIKENQIENIIMELRFRRMYVEKIKTEEYKSLESYKERERDLADLKMKQENLDKAEELKPQLVSQQNKRLDENKILSETNKKKNETKIENPSIEQVLSYIDNYRKYQSADQTANIKIEKPENNPDIRIVEVSYKGTGVSEGEPIFAFVFTNTKEFDDNIVYRIIDGYHRGGSIERTIDEPDTNELNIVGTDGSKVEVQNMNYKDEIKDYADSKGKTNERKQGMGPRVRKMDKAANSNVILLIISFLLLVLSAVLIIMIFTKT